MNSLHLLMTGPIRPDEDVFLENILKVKNKFNNAKFYFLSWKYNNEDFIKKISYLFDLFVLIDEPDNNYLLEKYPMTTQQVSIPDEDYRKHFTCCMHKMFLSNRFLIELLDKKKLLNDDDVVLRYRSDLFVDLDFGKNELLNVNRNFYYMNNRDHNSDDWFGICDYYTYKKIWNNPDDIYSEVVKSSFNAESIVSKFCQINNIKIQHLSFNEIYITRPVCQSWPDGKDYA